MEATKEIIGILNKDTKSRKILELFNKQAKLDGITGEAYKEARKTILSMCILVCPEALTLMSDEVYNQLNK